MGLGGSSGEQTVRASKQLENNDRDPKASAGKWFSNCFCHQGSTHLLTLGSYTRASNGNSHVSVCVCLSVWQGICLFTENQMISCSLYHYAS